MKLEAGLGVILKRVFESEQEPFEGCIGVWTAQAYLKRVNWTQLALAFSSEHVPEIVLSAVAALYPSLWACWSIAKLKTTGWSR